MKILIADDDASSRILLAATLRKLQHEVVVARSGTEAWEIFQESEVPLLISDVVMPDLHGLELCRRIRLADRRKYTYIMLLTAMGGKNSFLVGMRAGADDFITKPFDEEQLVARLCVAERILNLQSQVKHLSGLLPICCVCKKVRDDHNYWKRVESFVAEHTGANFTHGYCPECAAKMRQEIEAFAHSHPQPEPVAA
jgi:DNA-binding response OmpR family regulator